jgi:hypothetical protein
LPPVIEISRPRAPFIDEVVDQRVGDRGFGCGQRALLAGGFAGAHHRLAHLPHHRPHVGEVEVDQAFLDHQVGDAGNAGIEHLVGHREGVGEVVFSLATRNRFWFGMISSVSTTLCSSAMPASAVRMRRMPSKWKGLVTTPTVRMTHFARGLGDARGCAGAGAAAHAGGDEHHVGAREVVAKLRR